MSDKRHKNGPPARMGRLVGLLAFVVLVTVIYLLSLGSPLRAAPKPTLLGGPTEIGGIIDTDTTLPLAGAAAPTVASLSTNPKRINESAAAHSFIRSPFVDSTPGTTTRISAAPRLEWQPLESLTALNSTDLEAEAAATERGAPLSVFSIPSVASVVQSLM